MKLTAIKNEVNCNQECREASLYKMMDAHFLYASIHHFIISPYTKDRNHP